MKEKTPTKDIAELKDVDQMFDLVCLMNYMSGHLEDEIPVDDSRKIFKQIKKLLRKKRKKNKL